MSDDDKTVGGKIRGPRREDMDAIWQALSERDAATEMCETWSSVAAEQGIELSLAHTERLHWLDRVVWFRIQIRRILYGELTAEAMNAELRRLLADGGA